MRTLMLFRLFVVFSISTLTPLLSPTVLAQQQTSATITATIYACEPGMIADTLQPDACSPIAEEFDVEVISLLNEQAPLTLADSTFDGTSYTWSPGPAAASSFTGVNYGIRESVLPSNANRSIVRGDGVRYDFNRGYFTIRIAEDAPDATIAIYNFFPPLPGTTFDLPIVAINCERLPAEIERYGWFLNPNEECDPGVGLLFTATDATTGEVYDTCVTEIWTFGAAAGHCDVSVPIDTEIIVTEDKSTIPEGFLPEENPKRYHTDSTLPGGGGDGPAIGMVNVLAQSTEVWSLTIRAFACASGYNGDDWAGECSEPLSGVGFTSSVGMNDPEPQPFATSEDGSFSSHMDGAAQGNLITVTMPEGFERFAVYCTLNGGQEASFLVVDEDGIALDQILPGDEVLCDWYFVPFSGTTPTVGTTTPTPNRTELPLPEAGRPAHIHPGICGNLSDQDSYDLVDVRAATGTPEGPTQATMAESSFTVLDVSLDELLATPHTINVHGSRTAMRAYLVCGEIGGVRSADGSIAVGLREVNASAYEGIAYLAPDPADPSRTDVWIFVAPKLAGEERTTPTALPVASPTS